MILTMYEASKKYKMSRTALKKKSRKIPRPTFFVDVKNYEFPKIDDQNEEWKSYVLRINARNNKKTEPDNTDNMELIDKLISAMDNVLIVEFGEDVANRIKSKIIQAVDE